MQTLPADLQPFSSIDFSSSNCVVAAVSGGSDSLALLTLLHDALKHISSPKLLAVTVDHGLRPVSGDEARAVGAICAAMGVDHRIMRWNAPVPRTGVQAAARAARYALLCDAARDAGAEMVLTGHTLDDQLETVAMRARRGTGPGLAGIAPATFAFDRTCATAGTWFVRPLLTMSRDALRDRLRERGIAWIDDPSNADPRFERVRMRRALAAMNANEREALERRQADAALARRLLDEAAAQLVGAHAREVAAGLVRLDTRLFDLADTDAGRRAIAVLLAFAGGRAVVPDADKLRSWAVKLRETGRATLARCVAERRAGALWLRRENRGVAVGADGSVFDSRYGLCRGAGGSTVWLPQEPGEGEEEPAVPSGIPQTLARRAARLQPALRGKGQVWRPETGAPWYRIVNPWPDMVPSFDLATARAMARLAGVADIPAPPLDSSQTAS